MDNFYLYAICQFGDTIKSDETYYYGIVYSPKGTIIDAIERVCEDFVGKELNNVIEIKVRNLFEEGKYTFSLESLKEIKWEEW